VTSPQDGATRHQARERALSLLYEAEMKQMAPPVVLEALPVAPDPFCVALVEQSAQRGEEADRLVAEASIGWSIDRMAVIDRLVLRLAVVELMDADGPPVAVIIDEAVELAKTYSTDASGAFVNGILSTIASRLRP
jgi:transcription antitermination protein NusB